VRDLIEAESLRESVKVVLGAHKSEWISNLNIGNVMHLNIITADELSLHMDNSHEISKDAVAEKVVLLAVAYFCIGTELRFMSERIKEPEKQKRINESYEIQFIV
jgi:predicted proteasome-type protease